MTDILLPTTVVGSYPQPDWLVDRALLGPGAARARQEIWRVKEPISSRRRTTPPCSRSATWSAPASTSSPTARCAAKAIPTASPPRSRASTTTTPATITNRSRPLGQPCRAWSARCRRKGRSRSRDMEFLRRNTERMAKITLPGPFTMAQQAKNEFYKDARRDGDGLRRRGERGGARPGGGRRRRDPARRAVAAQRSRRGQAHRACARSTARSRG